MSFDPLVGEPGKFAGDRRYKGLHVVRRILSFVLSLVGILVCVASAMVLLLFAVAGTWVIGSRVFSPGWQMIVHWLGT